MIPRAVYRSTGLSWAARTFYREPKSYIHRLILEGGPIERRRTANGHRAMLEAASKLPTLPPTPDGPNAEITFLSGQQYWHQTLFCFLSLQLVTPFRVTPRIYDDGTLDASIAGRLLRVVPWMKIIYNDEIEVSLEKYMPKSMFPTLRRRRLEYTHLRKLTDIHIGGQGFTLVFDSDMLFFRRAHELENWFFHQRPLYMQDIRTEYGYPLPFLRAMIEFEIPCPVNVGIYSIDSTKLDWNRLEYWCRRQLEQFGASYLQEQALTAMALAGVGAVGLPKCDYRVLPDLHEGKSPSAVLHHYVAHSKRSYFQHGWRLIEKRLSSLAKHEGR